jgi:polyphosphate glucokinase
MTNKHSNILVLDVGGNHVKLLCTGQSDPVKIPSGPKLTAAKMAAAARKAAAKFKYTAVSIGYPGPVLHDQPVAEPHNLGGGWVGFDFDKAFGCPVKVLNDAAMQALGSYEGGRMLFLGLGTGLGSAMIVDGLLQPMELAHLPYKHGKTYEDYVGERALERVGKKKWRKAVAEVVERLRQALEPEYVVLGGGNSRLIEDVPKGVRLGNNANAFKGGFRMWEDPTAGESSADNPETPAKAEPIAPPARKAAARRKRHAAAASHAAHEESE